MSGYRLPKWRVTSPYGVRVHPITGARRMHNGDDLGADSGTPIKAIASGVVEAKGVNLDKWVGYGHWVRVRNYDGARALYAHMSEASPLRIGAKVSVVTTVGRVGSTGAATGPHLHLEISVGGRTVAPRPYAAARPFRPIVAPPTTGAARHVVTRGDTLGGIAKRYGTTWQTLHKLNRATIGSNPNRIFAGQVLVLPCKAKPKPVTAAPRVHVVRRGDTLGSIAKRYRTTWQKIHADNRRTIGANPNRIFAGQRLVIK